MAIEIISAPAITPGAVFTSQGDCPLCFELGFDPAPEPQQNCQAKYEVYSNGCVVYNGVVQRFEIPDGCLGPSTFKFELNARYFVKNIVGLSSPLIGEEVAVFGGGTVPYTRYFPTRTASFQIRFFLCCDGVTSDINTDSATYEVLLASCGCGEFDFWYGLYNYTTSNPPLIQPRFLNLRGSLLEPDTFCIPSSGTLYPHNVAVWLPDGNFDLLLTDGGNFSDTVVTGIIQNGVYQFDLIEWITTVADIGPDYVPGQLQLNIVQSNGAFIDYEANYYANYSVNCCCLTTVQFLNCWGTWESIQLGCFREQGIEWTQKSYSICPSCSNSGGKVSQVASSFYVRRFTLFSKPFNSNDESLRNLYEAFATATDFYIPSLGQYAKLVQKGQSIPLKNRKLQLSYEFELNKTYKPLKNP